MMYPSFEMKKKQNQMFVRFSQIKTKTLMMMMMNAHMIFTDVIIKQSLHVLSLIHTHFTNKILILDNNCQLQSNCFY